MKRLSIAVLVAIFCLVQSVPVPEESIDLVNIPLSDNKVSAKLFIPIANHKAFE